MRAGGGSGQRRQFFLVVIFIAMLVDGFLLAVIRANFLHDHGYDALPLPRAAAKLAPP